MNMSSLIEELKILQRGLNMAALLAALSLAFVFLAEKASFFFCFFFWSLHIITKVDLPQQLAVLDDCGSTARLRKDGLHERSGGGWMGGRGEGVLWHSQLNNWVSLR